MSIAESILVGRERNRRQSKSRSNGKKRAGQLRFEKILSRGLYVFSTNERGKNRTLSLAREELCSTDPTDAAEIARQPSNYRKKNSTD